MKTWYADCSWCMICYPVNNPDYCRRYDLPKIPGGHDALSVPDDWTRPELWLGEVVELKR